MARRPNPIDPTDLQLVAALQADANRRLEDLAREVKLAPSSVHDRLRRLEKSGIIRRWTIAIDAPALGLDVLAFIGVRASRPCAELAPALEALPAVEECHSVAGELSMLLKVRVANESITSSTVTSMITPRERICPTRSARSSRNWTRSASDNTDWTLAIR